MEFEEHVKFLRQFYRSTSQPTSSIEAPKGPNLKNAMRIMHLRSLLQNFSVFQELEFSVQAKLPPIAQYCSLRRGTALFRQGDAPGSCYIVLSGQCDAWHRACEGGSEDSQDSWSEASSTRPPSSSYSREQLEEEKHDIVADKPANNLQIFSDAADLGVRVATLCSGTLVGETALLKDQPRNATVVCAEDSEFLVIQREDFDSILKTDMLRLQQEKYAYLMSHVPSVREVPEKRLEQVAYSFEKHSFNKGHVFLEEGQVSQDCFYLVRRGSVEFRRREAAPVSAFEDAKKRGIRRLGTLIEGGLFGALTGGILEPFTVVATSSPCEVYRVSPRNCRHLPPIVMRGVEQYLIKATKWRLDRYDGLEGVPGTLNPATSKRFSDGRRNSGAGLSEEAYNYGCAQVLARRNSATGSTSASLGFLVDVQSAGSSHSRRRSSVSDLPDLSKSPSLPSLTDPLRRRASIGGSRRASLGGLSLSNFRKPEFHSESRISPQGGLRSSLSRSISHTFLSQS